MVDSPVSDEICVLVQRPVIDRDVSRHGISSLMEAGYRITVLDLANLVFPKLRHARDHYNTYEFALRVVESIEQLQAETATLRRAALALVYVGTGNLTWENLRIFRWLSKAGVPYVISYTNPVPLVPATRGNSLRSLSFRLTQGRLSSSALAQLPLSCVGVRSAAVQICGGRESQLRFRLVGPDTRRIFAHAWDYELFRSIRGSTGAIENIATYLDTYLGFHDDEVAEGSRMPVTPEHFYPLLRRLFDRIERELGLRVVVAAHPRANYHDKPGLYGDREIISGATHSSVARSRLVIGCHSTSVNFAVLSRCPVLLVTTREITRHQRTWTAIRTLASQLRLTPVSIDDPDSVSLDGSRQVHDAAYDAFSAAFIKDGASPDAPFWTIVQERLTAFGYLNRAPREAVPAISRYCPAGDVADPAVIDPHHHNVTI